MWYTIHAHTCINAEAISQRYKLECHYYEDKLNTLCHLLLSAIHVLWLWVKFTFFHHRFLCYINKFNEYEMKWEKSGTNWWRQGLGLHVLASMYKLSFSHFGLWYPFLVVRVQYLNLMKKRGKHALPNEKSIFIVTIDLLWWPLYQCRID
jgi:hypothetical protein